MHPSRTKYRLILLAILATLLVLQVFRLAFLGHFQGLHALAGAETWRALYLGLKFDLRLAAILVMPVWLLLKPGHPDTPNRGRDLWASFSLGLALSLYVAMVIIAMADERAARPWLLAFLGTVLIHRLAFRTYGLVRNPSARWIWGSYGGILASVITIAYFADFGTFG